MQLTGLLQWLQMSGASGEDDFRILRSQFEVQNDLLAEAECISM